MYVLNKNGNIKKKFIKITSGLTIGAMLGSPIVLSGCNTTPTKTPIPSPKPIENTLTTTTKPTSVLITTSPTSVLITTSTPNPSPIPTIEPTPSSDICTYAELAPITQNDVDQISVAKFKIDGKEKRAFFSSGSYKKAILCYDLFTDRPMFYELPDGVIPVEEVEKLLNGKKFEFIGYNKLSTYLRDIGVDKPLSEIHNYRDLRILYEKIIPEDQWFIMPWEPGLKEEMSSTTELILKKI